MPTKRPDRGIKRLGRGWYLIRARATSRAGKQQEAERKVKCRNLSEAIAKRDQLAAELLQELPQDPRITVADFCDQWLARTRDLVRASTRRTYADRLALVCSGIGTVRVADLRSGDVQACLAELAKTYSPETVNGCLRVLRSVVADAVADLDLRSDPLSRVRSLPTVPRDRRALAPEQLRRLLAWVRENDPEDYPALLTLALTGMRWGEMSALKWEDIDERAETITVSRAHVCGEVGLTKSGRARVCPAPAELLEALRAHRQRLLADQHPGLAAGWVFATIGRDGEAALRTPSSWGKAWPRWCVGAGVPEISAHCLRSTFVDLLRLAQVDAVVEHAVVGHAGEEMRQRYSTVRPAEAAQAVGRALRLVRGPE